MTKARITVMPKEGILDPEGRAIGRALTQLGFAAVERVEAGRVIELDLAATSEAEARALAKTIADRLLVNAVMQDYRIEIIAA